MKAYLDVGEKNKVYSYELWLYDACYRWIVDKDNANIVEDQ